MDSVSSRVPYKNLRQAELELVGAEEHFHHDAQHRIEFQGHHDRPRESDGTFYDLSMNSPQYQPSPPPKKTSLPTLILSCGIAAGVQFGWALQLSLLTPYIQTLGIQHAFSSFIWLCGPITGLVVQPCVGIWSDKCTSRYGRRRPFILIGSLMISVAVIIIGFSADIGYLLGDTKEDCRTFKGTRVRAAFIFVIGFWMLDLANNTVQGPARALLADLSGPDQRNSANAVFCCWMAVGNILGFSAGASGNWHRWFPFLTSRACCEACGNLKAAFLVAVIFLTICTLMTLRYAKEVPLAPKESLHLSDSSPLLDVPEKRAFKSSNQQTNTNITEDAFKHDQLNGSEVQMNSKNDERISNEEVQIDSITDSPGAVLVNLLTSMRHLPPDMHGVLIVMALTWMSWFPFFLFDTDWMGREVYHGNPNGDVSEVKAYDHGVRAGAFGLLLNSVVLGVTSFLIEPMCRWMGARIVWALSNFMVFLCMAGTAIISLVSMMEEEQNSKGIQQHIIGGSEALKTASLIVFALLGFPLAITYSVPFSVTAELTADSGGGQGLAIGVLNLAIVVPQMLVSLGAGPWDALFGGGNIPAFVLASVCAFAAGVVAMLKLPHLSSSQSAGFHFG